MILSEAFQYYDVVECVVHDHQIAKSSGLDSIYRLSI